MIDCRRPQLRLVQWSSDDKKKNMEMNHAVPFLNLELLRPAAPG